MKIPAAIALPTSQQRPIVRGCGHGATMSSMKRSLYVPFLVVGALTVAVVLSPAATADIPAPLPASCPAGLDSSTQNDLGGGLDGCPSDVPPPPPAGPSEAEINFVQDVKNGGITDHYGDQDLIKVGYQFCDMLYQQHVAREDIQQSLVRGNGLTPDQATQMMGSVITRLCPVAPQS